MVDEGLVQNRRWEKPFGGFSRKRFNGFIVNIWWSFCKWTIGGLKIKNNYDTTTSYIA
jgi:hypothetical protein